MSVGVFIFVFFAIVVPRSRNLVLFLLPLVVRVDLFSVLFFEVLDRFF